MNASHNCSSSEVALSFNALSISSLHPPTAILTNVSGFVVKGGITAVLGPSASGKSVLLQTLSGRRTEFHINGKVVFNGMSIHPNNLSNEISYVPQDSFLLGELTPRETLRNALLMKRQCTEEESAVEIDNLLKKFGLSSVADNLIGTIFVRGLSGGEKKRVEICSELISCVTAVEPAVLLLDEPTSGLDGSVAFEVLTTIKDILKSKKGLISVILTIHQPNKRILDLFDHIMLLGGSDSARGGIREEEGKGMLFFGTLEESISYFTKLGFPPPEIYTPTDVFLQVTDSNFRDCNDHQDFEGQFHCSALSIKLRHFLKEIERNGVYDDVDKHRENNSAVMEAVEEGNGDSRLVKSYHRVEPSDNVRIDSLHSDDDPEDHPINDDSFCNSLQFYCRQYYILTYREFTLACRDLSLYYLQFILSAGFGVMIGAVFFQLRYVINNRITDVPGGVLWIVMMMIYIHIFKVYHLSQANKRFSHEISNNTYSVVVYWLAELSSTAVLVLSFIPPTIIAYFMIGLPGEAFPYFFFLLWLVMCFLLFASF
jgi:ABC-type multidrug transport system ATPase subunit